MLQLRFQKSLSTDTVLDESDLVGQGIHRRDELDRLADPARPVVGCAIGTMAALATGPVDKDMKLLSGRLGLTPRVDIVEDEDLRRYIL